MYLFQNVRPDLFLVSNFLKSGIFKIEDWNMNLPFKMVLNYSDTIHDFPTCSQSKINTY